MEVLEEDEDEWGTVPLDAEVTFSLGCGLLPDDAVDDLGGNAPLGVVDDGVVLAVVVVEEDVASFLVESCLPPVVDALHELGKAFPTPPMGCLPSLGAVMVVEDVVLLDDLVVEGMATFLLASCLLPDGGHEVDVTRELLPSFLMPSLSRLS